ncbi:hypothetical protein L7F22_049273 [Adiantum nelumboides]|nr:hypothetical protein [Adiantum nelumboides]
MGSGKGSRAEYIRRAFRTVLFMVIMVASLLASSLPLLVSLVDVVAPCLLLSFFTCCNSCFKLHHDWAAYSFRTSLMDIPFLSLIRSLAIFCIYSICGIPNLTYGLYVSAAGICGGLSAILLVVKACVFANYDVGVLHIKHAALSPLHIKHLRNAWGVCLLFSCSMALALAHIMVAYKVKCQQLRKMHVYRLDPEAVIGLNTFLQIHANEKHRRLLIEDGWDGSPTQKDLMLKFVSNVGKP